MTAEPSPRSIKLPRGLALAQIDFATSGFEAILDNSPEKEVDYFSIVLFQEATKAQQAGETKKAAVLTLLGDLTGIMLRASSVDKPFHPVGEMPGGRTAMPEDFTEAELIHFERLASTEIDVDLRARVTDILWIRRKNRKWAEMAIEAYIDSAKRVENPESWPPCYERIERATRLGAQLGRGEPYLKCIIHIESLLDKYKGEDRLFLSFRLMELLLDLKEGDPAKYVALSEQMAQTATKNGDHRAQDFWNLNARWQKRGGDAMKNRDALINAAESRVKIAEEAVSVKGQGYIGASMHLRSAIADFKKIPGTKTRVQELHARLIDYQKKMLGEMKGISVTADLGPQIEASKAKVKGKASLKEALETLVTMWEIPSINELSLAVDKEMKNTPLQGLVPVTYVNEETGKTTAKRDSLTTRNEEDRDAAKRCALHRKGSFSREFCGIAIVEPAQAQIAADHKITESDILQFVQEQSFIPENRIKQYALGLMHGFRGEWVSSVHVLMPQFENSIRYVLSQKGIITSAYDQDGIQDEYDLNHLMHMPETKAIFGEDLSFDIAGLLVEHCGANLRNLLSHGLLSDEKAGSSQAKYFWWLIWRILMIPIPPEA